jgi:hypothetical protein
MARALTPREQERWRAMFVELYAERADDEPENEDQRLQTRVERLRLRYPDVFACLDARQASKGENHQ